MKDNIGSGKKRKDLLIVNHPKDIAKQLRIGQRAHVNYTEAALTVVGFESEKDYLENQNDDSEVEASDYLHSSPERRSSIDTGSEIDYTDISKKGEMNHHILFPKIEDEFDSPSKLHQS
jgi:hypothetical protein